MVRQKGQNSALGVVETLTTKSFLFQELTVPDLTDILAPESLVAEKLYSNRPIYTAFRPDTWLDSLYVVVGGGPVIVLSTPLDRVIAITYPGGCFGMRNLPVGFGATARAFPSLVEAYKTTDVIRVPVATVQTLYSQHSSFRQRYDLLFEQREKFQYHLLNCSSYPPQAVAALLRALVYQERNLEMGLQINKPRFMKPRFMFDLSIDLIARACQLNHRTVEQVLKGLAKAGYIKPSKSNESVSDVVQVVDPEGLKEIYGATRDKVSWWPLR
ncbi:MAG: Crp/Fnr family transcriptional regulator [Leptolyngbyaceae cyanobacterium SM2_5_2]|nr:Crp/Fnr family transcriptional regulator [Leptolyngbyaceae cyanobacterium SM2_5_2]